MGWCAEGRRLWVHVLLPVARAPPLFVRRGRNVRWVSRIKVAFMLGAPWMACVESCVYALCLIELVHMGFRMF